MCVECERGECSLYSEFLTGGSGTPCRSSELLKARPSPAEQVIVGHFSSAPLSTSLAFQMERANKKEKKSSVSFVKAEKMCVEMRRDPFDMPWQLLFNLTSLLSCLVLKSVSRKVLNVLAVFIWASLSDLFYFLEMPGLEAT